jgi:tetratricopeptide (TPR) repeat protein
MSYKQKIIKISVNCIFIYLFLNTGIVNSQSDLFGEKLLKMNQFKTVKGYLLNKLKVNPNDINALYLLGETYYKLGNNDSAHFYFSKGIVLNPNDYNCNIGIAKIMLDNSNNAEAKKIIEKVKLFSKYKDLNVMVSIADAYISSKNKQFEFASEILEKAKEIDITKPMIHIISGDLNSLIDKVGEAANDYERAIYYDKNCVEAFYKLGKIYHTARNNNESIKAYTNALNIDSTYIPVWRDLAELYYSIGSYQKASEAFFKYIQLTEPDLNDHFRYATILFFNKEYSKSLIETENALRKDPENFIMKRLYAYNLLETKDYQKSLIAINDFMSKASENKIISSDYEYYGKILSKNNKDSIAIIIFEKAMNMDSTKKVLYENIGASYDKLKKFEKAVEAYYNAITFKINPSALDYFALGKSAYFYGGSIANTDSLIKIQYLQKADTSFTKVIELSPKSHLGYFWKARVNALLDPNTITGIAKPWYEQVINILEVNPTKSPKDLVEAYGYMGVYLIKTDDIKGSKVYWNKIIEIDPKNEDALKYKDLKEKK